MNARVQTKPARVKGEDQFFTEDELSERISLWASVDRSRVLEPSAGDGGLAFTLLKNTRCSITCVEYDTVVAARLKKKLEKEPKFEGRFKVYAEDFMTFTPPPVVQGSTAAIQYPFDLAVMNPPYGSRKTKTVGMAHRHVAHALDFAPRVIVLCAASFEFGKRAFDLIFSKAHMTRRVRLTKRPGFRGPDNKGIQPQRDYTIMEFEHGRIEGPHMVETEEWYLR